MASLKLRKNIFISYSHQDADWLERLKVQMVPYIRGEKLVLWDDTKISPGAEWEKQIERAIDQARVAILLVTPSFLASDYVADVELPAILRRAGKDLILLWIPILPSGFKATPLGSIEAAIDPKYPLAERNRVNQEKALVKIAEMVASAMDINAVGNAFRIIDEFAPQASAFTEGRPEKKAQTPPRIRAEQVDSSIHLVDHGHARILVTADQLTALGPEDRRLIRAYERTMKELFDQWTELKPKRVSRDAELREEARRESRLIRDELCLELNQLLVFIESFGAQLQDHYAHIRYICAHAPA